MRKSARKHFWAEVLFAMLDIGSGDSLLVNVTAGIVYLLVAVAVVSGLAVASHLMHH